jgi:hypothetical protein
MTTKYIFYIIMLLSIGCNNNDSGNMTEKEIVYLNYDIVEIDSCEYFRNYTRGFHYVYTHKGNCKFCEIRRTK